MRFPRSLPLALLPFVAACSSDPRVLVIDVVTGHESDAMTQGPAVTTVKVNGTTAEGTSIEAEAAPGGELDFGEIDGDLAYQFEVTGLDGAGNTVLRGRSVSGIILNGVTADTLPLFAQRLGQWARPPGELFRAHTGAPAVSVGERYLLSTGGDGASDAAETEQYDLLAWAGARGNKQSFAAQTLVYVPDAATVLALGSGAVWFDGTGELGEPVLPDGLTTFDEVAGGTGVLAPDGRQFVVGGTRAGKETDAVLEIATDGTLTIRRLTFARAGAAAVWLADVGLVVVGGSATGNGVEVLAEAGTSFAPRDFPADPTEGAGAVITALGTIALIGGSTSGAAAKTRTLDPRCTSECKVKDLDLATPAMALTRVKAYALAKGSVLATGDEVDPDGTTRAFVIDYLDPKITELPLREPRRGATLVDTPTGTLALMGGVHPDGTPALTVEMYFPE